MSETPNVLKEKNSTNSSRFASSINSSNSKIKGSHLASHHNPNNHTPVNARTKLQFSSSKIDSSKKKKTSNLTKIATLNSANVATPPTAKILNNSNLKSGSSSKNTFGISPLCKGVDYSEIMQKKTLYGYTGPGYIVEFDCDSKHLRGLRVEKGLWKVTTRTTNRSKEAILGIGMSYTRIDEPERCTPLKQLTNYDFTYNPKSEFSGNLRKNLMYNFSNDDMNLEKKPAKPKKCLRWAENLERIEEKSQNISPNIEDQCDDENEIISLKKSGKKLRKSLSMSDINEIIAEIEKEDETLEEVDVSKAMINDLLPNKENLNITYDKDKEEQKSSQQVSQVIHYVVHLSPTKMSNSSFLDLPISANILPPSLNIPMLSPVKDLDETQTLSTNSIDFPKQDVMNISCENEDFEKKLDQFVDYFKDFFSEKNAELEQNEQFFLKQDFKNSINDQNRLNILLKFDLMEQMIRQFKMDIFKKTYNTTN